MALFDLLRTTDGFTDTDQAIAQYVMEHPDEVAELNIGELAKATHTSNAAVTRFCHKLGLEGYRAFRLELTRERERARLHVFDVNPDLPFMENATTQETMDSILNLSRNALEEAHQTITPESVSLAARLICEARRVAIYAVGDNPEAAKLAGLNVSKIKILVFTCAGILVGISAILLAARSGSADSSTGTGIEFTGIIACVLSGVALKGGEGTLWKAIVAVFVLGVLSNGMQLINLGTYPQYIAKGIIMLVSLYLSNRTAKKA